MVATLLGPVPLSAPIEDHVEEQRYLFCSRYDVCLARAAHEDWASWTCAHCVRFQRLRRARIQETVPRALSRQQDDATVPRPPARAEVGGRTIRSFGAGTGPVSATERLRDDEFRQKQKVSHAWEEEPGLLHMRLQASVPALFIEAARAVAELMRGRPVETSAEWAEEISIAAPDLERLLVAWIGELVRRSVESHVRFDEFDIIYVSARQLVASIRGVRLARMRNPVKSTTYHDPSLVQRRGHITAMPGSMFDGQGGPRPCDLRARAGVELSVACTVPGPR
jgi:SHS2 domain-containing protein